MSPTLRGLCAPDTALVIVAAAGALCDSALRTATPSGVSVHAWVIGLLTVSVAAQFVGRRAAAPARSRSEVRNLVRRLSRRVYVLLYVMILTRELAALCVAGWQDGFFDLYRLEAYVNLPLHDANAGLEGEARGYLLCGLVALCLIRVLARIDSRPQGLPPQRQGVQNL